MSSGQKMKKFKPKPGQVDFTDAHFAPVVNCVLRYQKKILIVQRSASLNFYPGYWNGVSGFLDDKKNIEQKIQEELHEELGLAKKNIVSFRMGEIFHQEEPRYKKTWIVHPILVEVNTDAVRLDWEAQKYEWIRLTDVKKFLLMPGFDEVLKKIKKR
jgi:isopentenyldiphosphate isomerase